MRLSWPKSLSSRLALVLIAGMVAAQALTGTIWFDARYGSAMEMPARLVAMKVADDLAILDAVDGAQRARLVQALQKLHFSMTLLESGSGSGSGPGSPSVSPPVPPAGTGALSANDRVLASMIEGIVQRRLGRDPQLQVEQIALGAARHGSRFLTVLTDNNPLARFTLQASLADGSRYRIVAAADQAGMDMQPLVASVDYLLRIYLLRFLIIALLAWFAVRLVLKPLNRLASAAQQLGHNIHSQPLGTDGPVEVAKAAAAFNAMQRRLIDNMAERTRFLAAVSHDLRSPITRLQLRAELLPDATLRAKFRQDLDETDALISSTLNVMKDVDPGEARQRIDIDSLLASVQMDVQEAGGEVTVIGKAQPLVGYPRSLKRCLQNLVENAVRYGARAQVAVTDTPTLLTIVVRDQGPGIAPELLEQVLEPYYRVEQSRNSATGGFGLGLSIAHTVAQAHQGTLVLRNGAAHGAGAPDAAGARYDGLEVILQLPR